MHQTTRQQRQRLKTENKKYGSLLTEIHRAKWPKDNEATRVKVWRSCDFLVQEFLKDDLIRVSVNRTSLDNNGRWSDQISWDELMIIKRQIGYGNDYAVEVYPQDQEIVNVANMRHIWILPEPLPIGWFRD